MTYFRWRSEYSVGVTKLDEQHKILVNMINELYEAMQASKGKETLRKVLKDWLKKHILETDMDYRTHFEQRGLT